MKLWLVALLVRTGLWVIRDGRLAWRWEQSDQWWILRSEQQAWWFGERLLPFDEEYRFTRARITGDNRRYYDRCRRSAWAARMSTSSLQ